MTRWGTRELYEAVLAGFPLQRTGVALSSNLIMHHVTFANMPNNHLYTSPFLVPRKLNLDRIGFYCSGGGTGSQAIRVGVYDDDGNRYPNNLMVDGGAIACAGAGTILATINQDLEPGLYWAAYLVDDNTIDSWGNLYPIYLIASQPFGYSGWDVAQAYGALPDPHPAGGTGFANPPNAIYRISAYY